MSHHHVRSHYDRHAVPVLGDVRQTLRERGKSRMYALKTFHNEVKRRLICRFSKGVQHHLDIACGRYGQGGGGGKWGGVAGFIINAIFLEVFGRRQHFPHLSQTPLTLCK